MTDPIEVMARRLHYRGSNRRDPVWDDLPDDGKRYWRRLATEELTALAAAGFKVLPREPNQTMAEKGDEAWGTPSQSWLPVRIWRAMWDAA